MMLLESDTDVLACFDQQEGNMFRHLGHDLIYLMCDYIPHLIRDIKK